jgi:YbbR domain-containing protein
MNIFKSLDIRLVALLLAAILWLHAVTEREYTVAFDCPVAVENVPADMVVSPPLLPASCLITAKGKDLVALRLKGPKLAVDAGNRRLRSLPVKLSEGRLMLPFEIEAVRVEFHPAELNVRLDRLSERFSRVSPDLSGQPAEGYIVSDSTAAEPCSVRVRGPERQVAKMDTVFTEKVKVDEMRERQRLRARLQVPDAVLFRAEPESVWVDLVFEKTGERLFRNVPLAIANRGGGYLVSYSPGTVDIVAAGPGQMLDMARASDIKATLDLKDLPPGTHRLQAIIELPDRLELIAATPRSFEVTIR